jgi:hypothetical protein
VIGSIGNLGTRTKDIVDRIAAVMAQHAGAGHPSLVSPATRAAAIADALPEPARDEMTVKLVKHSRPALWKLIASLCLKAMAKRESVHVINEVRKCVHHKCMCITSVCVCVCVCARARARVCTVRVRTCTHSVTLI